MLPQNLTKKDVKQVMEHMEKWDKKIVEKHGYFFKKIADNEVEIFTEDENEFWNYKLPSKQKKIKMKL